MLLHKQFNQKSPQTFWAKQSHSIIYCLLARFSFHHHVGYYDIFMSLSGFIIMVVCCCCHLWIHLCLKHLLISCKYNAVWIIALHFFLIMECVLVTLLFICCLSQIAKLCLARQILKLEQDKFLVVSVVRKPFELIIQCIFTALVGS